MQPVQINNDSEGTVEISAAEYKAVMEFSVAISEQNATVLDSLEALRAQMAAQAENLTATFASLVDAIAGLNITVNVPPQPAPIVNVSVPEQAAPVVNVKPAADRKKTGKVKFSRDKNTGAITSADVVIE